MKCANPSVDEEAILFDCPFCGTVAEMDEPTLVALWGQDGEGNITCPPPAGCGSEYSVPTLQELAALKTNAELAVEAPPAVEPTSEEPPPPTLDTTGQVEPPPSIAQPETAAVPPSTADLEKKIEKTAAKQEVSTKEIQSDTKSRQAQPEPAANEGDDSGMSMAIRTFRHGDWQGGGEDNFDSEVSKFLKKTGTDNVVSVTPVSYTDKDEKLIDYGVMVVYERPSVEIDEKEEPVVWKD